LLAGNPLPADEAPATPARVRFNTTEPPATVLFLAEQDETEAGKTEYWLGIGLEGEVPDVLKRHLNLDHGLVVADVAEDSPAAKAEVKKYDILLKAGDEPLKTPKDLIETLQASDGKELTILIFRDGKNATLHVTPAKRPATDERRYSLRTPSKFGPEIKGLEEALAKLKGKAGEEALNLLFARPGVMSPQLKVLKPNELPKNVSVRITKEGSQPAKIHVKKDDQEWEVTEDKLGDLPEDLRPHVQQFLARPMNLSLDLKGSKLEARQLNLKKPDGKVEAELKFTPPPGAYGSTSHSYTLRSGPDLKSLDSKLDAVIKALDRLSKEVDELRSRSPGDKK
jgi:hypothetical protein